MKRTTLSSVSTTYTPPSLEESGVSFILRCPTENEEDRFGAELFRRGIIAPELTTIRATIIEELYRLEPDEAKADEQAGYIEQLWNAEVEHSTAVSLWMEQERERLRDIRFGAPEYARAAFPTNSVPLRAQSKAQLVLDKINAQSQTLRELSIAKVEFETVAAEWRARLYIIGWSGLKTPVAKDETGEALTEECLDKLCVEIGHLATRELNAEINGSFTLSMEEVGNFDLPVKSDTGPTPSPAPSDELESSAGSSTTSPIEQIHAGELELKTEKS